MDGVIMLTREVEAQSAAAPAGGVGIVGAGKDRFDHPHTMGFSSGMLFKVSGSDTNGGLFVIDRTDRAL
jgi:hypothetical protein